MSGEDYARMNDSEDEIQRMFAEMDTFDKYVELMEDRVSTLQITKCLNCESIGLEAISVNDSICNVCQTIHNL